MKKIYKDSAAVIIRNETVERYLKDIKAYQPVLLTQAEEQALLKAYKFEGNQLAREKLITANLRFVVTVAKEYQVKGFLMEDIINAGNLGLMRAIEKFEVGNPVKFISYAVHWIKNAIIEHIKEYKSLIRIPFNKQIDMENFEKEKQKLQQKTHEKADNEQILSEGIWSIDIRTALMSSKPISSLDMPMSDGESADNLSELIGGDFIDPMEQSNVDYRNKMLYVALSRLTETQQKVLSLSFGLDDKIERSNEDIADQLHLTSERVRQIKRIGLERLKMYSGNRLEQLMD